MFLFSYLISFSDDLFRSCVLSGLELKDIISLEIAIVKSEQRIRIRKVAQKILSTKISVTSHNVRSLLKRNISFVETKFMDVVHSEEIIMASEMMENTKEISVMVHCTDAAIFAIARGAPNLVSIGLYESLLLTDRALIAIATHCSKLKRLELRLTSNITRNGLEVMCRECPMLEVLCVNACWSYSSVVDVLHDVPPFCTNLRTLDVANFNISNETVGRFAEYCPKLTSVTIKAHHDHLITDAAVNSLVTFHPDLHTISLNCVDLSPQCLLSLANNCTKLTSLYLKNIAVTNEVLNALGSHCGPKLEQLELYVNNRAGDADLLLQHCSRLTDVKLHITSPNFHSTAVSLVQRNPLLRKVDLSDTLSSATVRAIADCCPHLQVLRLGAFVGDPGDSIVYLAERCTALLELHMWVTTCIGERAVRTLAAHCSKLQELEISLHDVSNDALVALVQGCPGLRSLRLELYSNPSVNVAVVQALSRCCQKLRLLVIGRCSVQTGAAIKAMIKDRRQRGILLHVLFYTVRWFAWR